MTSTMIGRTLSHYRIDRRLGEGGMGVVYAAHDLRLRRDVALKVIRSDLGDLRREERFWREARAAAQISHPNICVVHELLEHEGQLCIVMELLEGETLADRLERRPETPREAIRIGLDLLSALAALHQRGLVHRDLKPSNVFVLGDGRVKLLDFGLAVTVGDGRERAPNLTASGAFVGSPRYMAPEQVQGAAVDGRADLFSLAVVLHEAVTGQPLFQGRDAVEVLYRMMHAPIPAIGGSPALDQLGRVLARALVRDPAQRIPSADAMAEALRAIPDQTGEGATPVVERLVRLAVVPFRMLRPDPELDFMGPSLADAIAMSLAGIRSLVVRAPVAAAAFATGAPDLHALARALDADVALFGTVLQSGGRCRVASQLVDVPGGEVRWSETAEVSGGDVFEIQDQLARRIVESLQLPLSARERRALGSDVPASATAYEFFLRAQRMLQVTHDVTVARDLYRRAVDEDPRFAPAWAGLGRTLRLMAKFLFETDQAENLRAAEKALARALELHPDMPSAHHTSAHQELDSGRIDAALARLRGMVERNPNDPLGFAGLVAGYRYLGLLEQSVAAEARVRALDPRLPTSFLHTLDALGEYERALRETGPTSFSFDRARLLAVLGRNAEAEAAMHNLSGEVAEDALGLWRVALRAAMSGDRDATGRVFARLRHYPDPEGVCAISRCLVRAGDHENGVTLFETCVERGYSNVPLFRNDPWYQPVREHPRFRAALAVAEERHQTARARYAEPAA